MRNKKKPFVEKNLSPPKTSTLTNLAGLLVEFKMIFEPVRASNKNSNDRVGLLLGAVSNQANLIDSKRTEAMPHLSDSFVCCGRCYNNIISV